nr:hypothetical protein [Tanacetum cinerariifolium]
MISLGLSLSESFLVVRIDCKGFGEFFSIQFIMALVVARNPLPTTMESKGFESPNLPGRVNSSRSSIFADTSPWTNANSFLPRSKLFAYLSNIALYIRALRKSKMSFHQALNLILNLTEAAVGCTWDILRKRDCLDRLSEIPWVVPTFVVIEGEDIIMEFCRPWWKELSKETSSKILSCGDGSC